MRHPFLRIGLCLLGVVNTQHAAGAQTVLIDGVQSLIRGDYEAAVRALRPLAEGAPQPDPLAQFFMAMLYNSGRGVNRNPSRACGLYLSAATPGSPLMNQALDLARIIQEPYSGAWGGVRICFPADTYPWQDPPPASFTLGPDHWVVIDATGTTVEFEGAQHHNGMAMGGAGLVFLPVLYTALDVSRPVEMRRHFVQSFMWRPEASAELLTWSLAWTLSEVVGADVKTLIGSPDLMTITASQPPASIDVSKMVQVRVNANGEAEWVRLTGSTPQSEVIPFKAAR